MATTTLPEQGKLVQFRSRPWVVNHIEASNLPIPALKLPIVKPQHLLARFSVEVDGLGDELQFVWEIEPSAKLIERVALPEPAGFDSPNELDAVRSAAASTANHKTFRHRSEAELRLKITSLKRNSMILSMFRVCCLTILKKNGLNATKVPCEQGQWRFQQKSSGSHQSPVC